MAEILRLTWISKFVQIFSKNDILIFRSFEIEAKLTKRNLFHGVEKKCSNSADFFAKIPHILKF